MRHEEHTARHRAPRHGTRSVPGGRSHTEHGNEHFEMNVATNQTRTRRGDSRVALCLPYGTPPGIARRAFGITAAA